VKGRSVPASRSTWNCSGLRIERHSSGVRSEGFCVIRPIKLVNMPVSERDRAEDWFRRFADSEGRESVRYRDWALGLADDAELLSKIVSLPVEKRQPALILACARFVGVPLRPFSQSRSDFLALWPRIAKCARTHSVQTNDPRRCSPLLVALQRIRGPISLIEVGASAGLTLIPDKYSYRFGARGRTLAVDPTSGESSVVLTAALEGWGASELRMPTIVHREGIDLEPLDVNDADNRAWLNALVWPEQADRLALVTAAAELAREAGLTITAGDAVAEIRAAVARARKAAPRSTIVIWSPAVLVYLEPAARKAFQRYCTAAKVRWISVDGRNVLPGLDAAATRAGLSGAFVLSCDGTPIAEVDPLGRRITLAPAGGLTAEDVDLIEFERVNWGPVRGKESLVREHWGLSLVRYYQRVYAIMEGAAARRYDPVLASTLERARRQRVARRSGE